MPFCLVERHHFSNFGRGHSRNIPVKLFQNPLTGLAIFSSGGHFVKPKGTSLAILVKGHKRNISVKLF